MTDADHAETYEQRVLAIQLANQPILDCFESWLLQAGWSEKTIQDHMENYFLSGSPLVSTSKALQVYPDYSLRRDTDK